MTLSLTSAHEWRISTRARGEVLAATARGEGCQLLVLGAPGGPTVPEMEGWLGDLLGVAAESTRNDQNTRTIPTLLHHALTGLLFSHREVWNSGPQGSTFSLAFVHAGDDVAFGHVGEGAPQVWIDDRPVAAEWVRVRDHVGREARALRAPAGATVRVVIDWSPGPAGSGVQVDAVWSGGATAGAGIEDMEPDAAPFTIAEIVPELIPPTPEPQALTERAIRPPSEPEPAPEAESAVETRPPVAGTEPVRAHAPVPVPPPARAANAELARAAALEMARGAALEPAAGAELDPTRGAASDPLAEPALPPARPVRPRPRMRPAWPSEQEISRAHRRGVNPWMWAALVVALVAGAWALGLIPGAGRPFGTPLASLGVGVARFKVTVDSRPPGAWIAAGGKDLSQRTPATIELPAGEHEIALSFPDLGSAAFTVRGARGDRQSFSVPLWGTVAVRDADADVPIAVDLDGTRLGIAPVTVDSVAPGPHELRFSGPGLAPWGQALRVRIGEITEVIARPMSTPANGVLEVRATYTDGDGTMALDGAAVWVDGERRGVTPLVLELPRGPHSARVEYKGESAPIQVIDLPGGNQRFASFELGLNLEHPTLEAGPLPSPVPAGRPTVISGILDGVSPGDVRELWLHVREPDGVWRRYQMVMLKAPGGVVGVALFPTTLFDSRGTTRYYMYALTQTGDEYFTEIYTARSIPRQPAAAR